MSSEEKLLVIGKLCDIAKSHPSIACTILEQIKSFLSEQKIDPEIVSIGILEGKLRAVSALKNKLGISIIDAKNMLEEYFTQNGHKFKNY